jgi:signal transduction histidine kinase/phage shock protein PspC (stress-responsive transcriptional regulator)
MARSETASGGTSKGGVRRLYRSTDDRIVAGVCGGLAEHLRLDSRAVRIAFAVLTLAGGAGLVVYGVFWAVVPQQPGGTAPAPRHHRRRHLDHGDLAAFALLAAGALLVARQFGVWLGDAVVWPVVATAAGVGLIWRQADESQRARWSASARRPLLGEGDRRVALARLGAGAALVAAGVGGLLAARDGLQAARNGVFALLAAVIGLALLTGPWWWRLATELTEERRERVRAQERAEVAAHIHDSVLQTLALIQSKADRPAEVQRLARAQERELRSWLFAKPSQDGDHSLVKAMEAAAAEVEAMHTTSIDVVAVGDCPLDERLAAVVAAAREAMVNAAKFAGVAQVQVFVEVEGDHVTVYVRDRGAGFDPAAVGPDRQGVAESIVGRMTRNGGTGTVRSSPGHGTEVELTITRDRP